MLFPSMRDTDTDVERKLKQLEVITSEQRRTWGKIRNRVMHGHLTSPWGPESEDAMILEMARLVHALTHHLLDREVPPQPPPPSTPSLRKP